MLRPTQHHGDQAVVSLTDQAIELRAVGQPGKGRTQMAQRQEPVFRLNDEAVAWLEATSLPHALRKRLLAGLPWDRDLTDAALRQHLTDAGVSLNRQQQQQVWDALAVAAYHAQTGVPVRHYAKLRPQVPHHQALLDDVRKNYWTFYRALLAYREAPGQEERARLADAFDTLVDRETGYEALDDRIVKTADKRAQLLAVLDHPNIPLHNNDMEPGARRRVRKRDVSFGPQSRAGARARDTFQTLAATAARLGVSFFHYLRDRLVSPDTTPSLAERIAERAGITVQPTG